MCRISITHELPMVGMMRDPKEPFHLSTTRKDPGRATVYVGGGVDAGDGRRDARIGSRAGRAGDSMHSYLMPGAWRSTR